MCVMINTPDNEEQRTASFEFATSPAYRVVHVDGVWGGITPHGLIQMALFSDRKPFPSRVDYQRGDGGVLEEVRREQTDAAFEREIEVSGMLSVGVAKSLAAWLEERVAEIEAIHATAVEEQQETE
jgi:hypothetical protein